jgi:hypothetical protein
MYKLCNIAVYSFTAEGASDDIASRRTIVSDVVHFSAQLNRESGSWSAKLGHRLCLHIGQLRSATQDQRWPTRLIATTAEKYVLRDKMMETCVRSAGNEDFC